MKRAIPWLSTLLMLVLLIPATAEAQRKRKRRSGSNTTTTEEEVRLEEVGVLRNRDVRVVQRRLYVKDGRKEIGPMLGYQPFDRYTLGLLAGARFGIHRSELIGFDISIMGGYGFGNLHYQEITGPVYTGGASGTRLATDAYRTLIGAQGGVEISPFYAKVAVNGRKIFHHEVYFNVGASVWLANELGVGRFLPVFGPQFGVGLRVYATKNMMVLVELRDHVLFRVRPIGEPGQVVQNQIWVNAGVSFWLDKPEAAAESGQ